MDVRSELDRTTLTAAVHQIYQGLVSKGDLPSSFLTDVASQQCWADESGEAQWYGNVGLQQVLENVLADQEDAPDVHELLQGAASSSDALHLFPPVVNNHRCGDTVRYRWPLLRGTVHRDVQLVRVSVLLDGVLVHAQEWPAVEGLFKAIAPLECSQGESTYTVRIQSVPSGPIQEFPLRFVPQTNRRYVRMIYAVASDGDGSFDAPLGVPNDMKYALPRMRTAALLMQSFTAEKLHEDYLGRRTFNFEEDDVEVDQHGHEILDGETDANSRIVKKPRVLVYRCEDKTMADFHKMSGHDLWLYFFHKFGDIPDRDRYVDCIVMSMTRWDVENKRALAHTAMGGSFRTGVFGSGTLFTWATGLDDLVRCWLDETRVDMEPHASGVGLFEDSGGRGCRWANFSTALGATLHEIGHVFTLHHTKNNKGIMSRAFDYFNRTFMVTEPPSTRTPGLPVIHVDDETKWNRPNAVRLHYHRFFALDEREYASDSPPIIEFDTERRQIVVRSGSEKYPLRTIAMYVNTEIALHKEFFRSPIPAIHHLDHGHVKETRFACDGNRCTESDPACGGQDGLCSHVISYDYDIGEDTPRTQMEISATDEDGNETKIIIDEAHGITPTAILACCGSWGGDVCVPRREFGYEAGDVCYTPANVVENVEQK